MSQVTTIWARLREKAPPQQLAAVRIALGLYVAWIYTSPSWQLLLEIGGRPNRLTNTYLPERVEAFLHGTLVPPLITVALVAALVFAAGLYTRVTSWVLFASFVLTHHFYYRQCHYHDEWPYLWLFLLVMAMAPCADVWSLDRWRMKRRCPELAPPEPSLAYRWPIEVMIGWFGIIYGAAGIAKLMPLSKGVDWVAGPTIHRLVGLRYFESPVHWALGEPLFDYSQAWPFELLAYATVAIELGGLLLLVSRWFYPWVYGSLLCLHLGIYAFGVPGFFATALVCGLLFAPSPWLSRLEAVLSKRHRFLRNLFPSRVERPTTP